MFERLGLSVFPNPTAGMVYFSEAVDIEVYDLMGKKVASSDNKKYIDMSNLEDGMYNIIVEYKELLIHKLIIKNGKTY